MTLSHPRGVLVLVLATLALAATLPPLGLAQTSSLCEDPDGTDDVPAQVERPYDDLIVDVKDVQIEIGDADPVAATVVGAHYLTNDVGRLSFKLDVRNIGSGTGGPTGQVNVRVGVGQPNGAGLVHNVPVEIPARGTNKTVSTHVDLTQEGRHTLHLEVNPQRTISEECKDPENTANPACPGTGGVPGPCHFTYYGNNGKAYGLLVKTRADLVVSQVIADGPIRATAGDHADSRVTLRATLQNLGPVRAYNLAALTPGAETFPVKFEITGCTCQPATVQVDSIDALASKTIEVTMNAHQLASKFTAKVTIDPPATSGEPGLVIESNEGNNAATQEFPIPTADLMVSVAHDLETSDGRVVVPKGHPLEFVVNVQNIGDAKAARTSGDGFRIVGSRDSPANSILLERLTLDAHSSVTYRLTEEAANLTGNHDFKIVVDDQKEVLEANEANNEFVLRVTVALFQADLKLTEADANPTVPPGVTGRVPFEVVNKGTVADTFTLSVPLAEQGAVSFVDASGGSVRDVALPKDGTFKGELLYDVPGTAVKGDVFSTRLQVTSYGSGNVTVRNVTFTAGDDTVAPSISLDDPANGYLSSNKVVIRVTDNVNVSRVETDVTGSFVTVRPDDTGGSLYTVDVTGRPASFKLNVRATDTAGNEVTKGFDLVRDTTPPRVAKVSFTPERGVVPGTRMTVLVDARDENMKDVVVTIKQPRPGGLFTENHTLLRTSTTFQLRDWVVPERPGHYIFNVTAIDQAGNKASREQTLSVQGLNLRVPPSRSVPVVTPPAPREGETVRMTWFIENTSPLFESGEMLVGLGIDAEHLQEDVRRLVGVQRINLAPGEVRPVTFAWPAAPGKHFFTLVIDQGLQVAEDNENDNAPAHSTETLWGKDYPLFASLVGAEEGGGFGDRLVTYWFVPVLFVATVVLFVVALALGRRTVA